jgi:hypothetical protein
MKCEDCGTPLSPGEYGTCARCWRWLLDWLSRGFRSESADSERNATGEVPT